MLAGLTVHLNGEERHLSDLADGVSVLGLIDALGLKPDRIAIELNGSIARRISWNETGIHNGDRVEIVHFVGGGAVRT